MPKYFVLVERLSAEAPWGVQFGDFDRDVVDDEYLEYRNRAEARNLRVLAVKSAKQADIDARVASLNVREG